MLEIAVKCRTSKFQLDIINVEIADALKNTEGGTAHGRQDLSKIRMNADLITGRNETQWTKK